MRARLSVPAALAALAVAGSALTGFAGPAAASPAPAVAAAASASQTGAATTVTHSSTRFATATAYRAKGIKIRVAHKRISRAQLAKHGMKVTVTGLRKRTQVYIGAGLPNTNEPVLWSKTVRASASGRATLTMPYSGRKFDRRGRHLPRGKYMVAVSTYAGDYRLFHNAFRVR